MSKPKLTIVDPEAQKRAGNIAAEIGQTGLDPAFDWDERPSGWSGWAERARRFLDDVWVKDSSDGLSHIEQLMLHWRRMYRHHTARFLETRAQVEVEQGNIEGGQLLMYYASTVAHGRNLDPDGDFVDMHVRVVGYCDCGGRVRMQDWTMKIDPVKPGDRHRHGRGIYTCPRCETASLARHLHSPSGPNPGRRR